MEGTTYIMEELAYTARRTGDSTYINCNSKYISAEVLAQRGFALFKVLRLIKIPNLKSQISNKSQ
jgi:hypothetical protein